MALLAAAGTGIAMGRDWATVVAAALALGIATGINSYIVSVLSALRRRTAVAFFQGLDAWLKPLVALPFLLVAGRDAAVALAGFFCATLIVSAAQYPASIRARTASPGQPESPALRREIRSEVVRYAASFAAFSAFGAISTYADRWIVLGVAGEHDLGVYAAMYQVANAPFVVVVGIITQLITPALFDRAGGAESAAAIEHSDRLLAHSIAASIAIMGAMVACGWLLARPLMMLLTSSDFAERSSLLGPIMLSLAIFQVGQLHSLKGLVHRSPEIYFWPKALQALALLVIGYALMKLFGIEGLVLALNLSALAYLASVLIANRKLAVMR
jgi:O-antigen/teichoic acid export membrane protein